MSQESEDPPAVECGAESMVDAKLDSQTGTGVALQEL